MRLHPLQAHQFQPMVPQASFEHIFERQTIADGPVSLTDQEHRQLGAFRLAEEKRAQHLTSYARLLHAPGYWWFQSGTTQTVTERRLEPMWHQKCLME